MSARKKPINRCPHCGHSAIWTRQTILQAFVDWAAKHGRSPSVEDWTNAGKGHPSGHTVRQVFGSFAKARKQAGLTFQRKNHAGDWTRDEIIDAIVRWRFVHGRIPARNDWQASAEGRPSCHRVESVFGTWNGAIVAAGYEPRRATRSKQSYRASMASVTKAAA